MKPDLWGTFAKMGGAFVAGTVVHEVGHGAGRASRQAEVDALEKEIRAIQGERNALRADNAALIESMKKARDELDFILGDRA